MWWKEPINSLHLLSVFDFFNKLIKLEFLIIEVSFQSILFFWARKVKRNTEDQKGDSFIFKLKSKDLKKLYFSKLLFYL